MQALFSVPCMIYELINKTGNVVWIFPSECVIYSRYIKKHNNNIAGSFSLGVIWIYTCFVTANGVMISRIQCVGDMSTTKLFPTSSADQIWVSFLWWSPRHSPFLPKREQVDIEQPTLPAYPAETTRLVMAVIQTHWDIFLHSVFLLIKNISLLMLRHVRH